MLTFVGIAVALLVVLGVAFLVLNSGSAAKASNKSSESVVNNQQQSAAQTGGKRAETGVD